MKINVKEFFFNVKDEKYCIIKSFEIDNYKSGSDIDIFCYDIKSFSKKILDISKKYINYYEVVIKQNKNENHVYIDFQKKNKKIELRFDLYGSLPRYEKLSIKEGLFSSIIENRIKKEVMFGDEVFYINIPSLIDDVLIRYIEFQEWYNIRPDKIKHINYIENLLTKKIKKDFLDKLHFYTEFKTVTLNNNKYSPLEKLKDLWMKLKGKSIKEILIKIKKRVK